MATDVPADDCTEHASSYGATVNSNISEGDQKDGVKESDVEYVIREPCSGNIHSQRSLELHARSNVKANCSDKTKDDELTALLEKAPRLQAAGSAACGYGQSDSAASSMCLAGQVLQKLGCALQPRLMGRLGEVPASWRLEMHGKSEET